MFHLYGKQLELSIVIGYVFVLFGIAKKSGLNLDDFWHYIRASAGNSFLWETCGPNIFRGDFHDSFALELQCKDIRLFTEMAKNTEVSTNISFIYIYIYIYITFIIMGRY